MQHTLRHSQQGVPAPVPHGSANNQPRAASPAGGPLQAAGSVLPHPRKQGILKQTTAPQDLQGTTQQKDKNLAGHSASSDPLKGQKVVSPAGLLAPIKPLHKTLQALRAGKTYEEAFERKETNDTSRRSRAMSQGSDDEDGGTRASREASYISIYFPMRKSMTEQHNPAECKGVCTGFPHAERGFACRFCFDKLGPRYKEHLIFNVRSALDHIRQCRGIPSEEDRKDLYNGFRQADRFHIENYHTSEWKAGLSLQPEASAAVRPQAGARRAPQATSHSRKVSDPPVQRSRGRSTSAGPRSGAAPEAKLSSSARPVNTRTGPHLAAPRQSVQAQSSWGVPGQNAQYHQGSPDIEEEVDDLEEAQPHHDPKDGFRWRQVHEALPRSVAGQEATHHAKDGQQQEQPARVLYGSEVIMPTEPRERDLSVTPISPPHARTVNPGLGRPGSTNELLSPVIQENEGERSRAHLQPQSPQPMFPPGSVLPAGLAVPMDPVMQGLFTPDAASPPSSVGRLVNLAPSPELPDSEELPTRDQHEHNDIFQEKHQTSREDSWALIPDPQFGLVEDGELDHFSAEETDMRQKSPADSHSARPRSPSIELLNPIRPMPVVRTSMAPAPPARTSQTPVGKPSDENRIPAKVEGAHLSEGHQSSSNDVRIRDLPSSNVPRVPSPQREVKRKKHRRGHRGRKGRQATHAVAASSSAAATPKPTLDDVDSSDNEIEWLENLDSMRGHVPAREMSPKKTNNKTSAKHKSTNTARTQDKPSTLKASGKRQKAQEKPDSNSDSDTDSASDAPMVTATWNKDFKAAQTKGLPSEEEANTSESELEQPSGEEPAQKHSSPRERPSQTRRFERFGGRDRTPEGERESSDEDDTETAHRVKKKKEKNQKQTKRKRRDVKVNSAQKYSPIKRRFVEVSIPAPTQRSARRQSRRIETSDEGEGSQEPKKRLKTYQERQQELSSARRSASAAREGIYPSADCFFVDVVKDDYGLTSLPEELHPWANVLAAIEIDNLETLQHTVRDPDNADEFVAWLVKRTKCGELMSLPKQFPLVQAIQRVLAETMNP